MALQSGRTRFEFLIANAQLGLAVLSVSLGFHVCKMVIIIVSASETCALEAYAVY